MTSFEVSCQKNIENKAFNMRQYANVWYKRTDSLLEAYLGTAFLSFFIFLLVVTN